MNDPVNLTVLASLREIMQDDEDDSLFIEVINLFCEDTPGHFFKMREAIGQANSTTLKQSAHSLKGSCANLGAQPMAEICLSLEEIGRRGSVEGADHLLEKLEFEYTRVQQVLDHAKNGLLKF